MRHLMQRPPQADTDAATQTVTAGHPEGRAFSDFEPETIPSRHRVGLAATAGSGGNQVVIVSFLSFCLNSRRSYARLYPAVRIVPCAYREGVPHGRRG